MIIRAGLINIKIFGKTLLIVNPARLKLGAFIL